MNKKNIYIGKILRPHGLKGEISIRCLLEDESSLDHLREIILKRDNASQAASISSWRYYAKGILISLRGVDDRNAAEDLAGAEIYAHPEDLPKSDPDDIFLHELVGCRVELADGQNLGSIKEIMTPASQEIWTIAAEDGAEILFPAVPEFVESIDIEGRMVRIDPPDGLLEICST